MESEKLTRDEKYRMVQKGEIIQDGDEVDVCNDGWRDGPVWQLAKCIGEPAPDPSYPSHRVYRRPIGAAPFSERLVVAVVLRVHATTQLHNVPQILREIATQVEHTGCCWSRASGSGTSWDWEVRENKN